MNSVAYLPQSKRLLDQVREVLRYKHYSLKTGQVYLCWVRLRCKPVIQLLPVTDSKAPIAVRSAWRKRVVGIGNVGRIP